MFSFLDGTVFGLSSVDLAGYSTYIPDFSVEFVGQKTDGSMVTTTFTGTGINFQTFQFGAQWSGLTSVEIPSYAYSMDNLVLVTPVPEPSATTLAALGILAPFLLKAGRKSSKTTAP